MFRGPQVLDSWMEPSVVRKREVTSSSGDKETFVEPLIMERHERVMIPYTEESVTQRRTQGPSIISHQSYSSKSVHHVRRHHIAQRRHTPVISHAVSRRRYVAKNVTTISTPSQVEIQRRVVEKSVVVDRKDPALSVY
jgi:hypothetical protein